MRKRITGLILLTALLLALCGQPHAKTYAPLKYRADYSIRGDDFYFLDLDRDGLMELYVCNYGNTGSVNVYDEYGKFVWNTWFRGMQRAGGCTPVGEDITRIYVDDINYNKDLDIMAASKVRGEKSNMNPVSYYERETEPRYNVHSLEERWRYNEFDGILTTMIGVDMDKDSAKEIVAGSTKGFVYVLGNTGVKKPESYQRPVTNRTYLFNIPAGETEEFLKKEIIPEDLAQGLKNNKNGLSEEAFVRKYSNEGSVENQDEWMEDRDKWMIYNGTARYLVVKDGKELRIYKEEDSIKTIYTYRMDPKVLEKYTLDGSVYSLHAGDFDGDGGAEIVAGTFDRVYLIDGDVKWNYPVGDRVISVASAPDIEQGYAVAATDGNKVYYIGSDGRLRWTASVGNVVGVAAADIDNDTSTEILIASENSIKALRTNGSFKWEYPLGDDVKKMYLLSESLLAVGSAKSAHLLETDNGYAKNQSGYEYYQKALAYYIAGDCDKNAKPLAKKAQDIFMEINNTEGAMRCDEILLKCKGDIDEKRLADQYLAMANEYYGKGQYDEAGSYARRAMEIYAKRGDGYSVVLCDQLLQKIEAIDRDRQTKEADRYYSEAYWYYTSDEFENATIYLEKALRAYREINYTQGIKNCEYIYEQMDLKEKNNTATWLFEQARAEYGTGAYNESLRLMDEAREIYAGLNMTGKMEEIKTLKNLAEKSREADGLLASAEGYYASGDNVNAAEYANKSMEAYMSLENYEKAAAANYIILEVGRKEKEKNQSQTFTMAGAAAAAVLTILASAIVVNKIRNKRKEKNEDKYSQAWTSVQQGQEGKHPHSPGGESVRR